jgi:DNA-binding GntR family transcriptional regulator
MIEALRTGDRESLIKLCREHLVPARDAYLEAHHRRSASHAERKSATD